MTRRQFLASSFLARAAAGAERRPNVLIFLTDQESNKVDRRLLKTPNRDRLESSGVSFTRAWCATPQCSPARGALWTGLYPHRNGVVTNIAAIGSEPLSPETPNIGSVFQDAAYETAYFGKWHLTSDRELPEDNRFGFGHTAGADGSDANVAERAADWIRSRGDKAWLAVISLIQPHDIYHFPREYRQRGEALPVRENTPAPPSGPEDLDTRPTPQREFLEHDQGHVALGYDAEDWQRYRSFYYRLIEDADRNLGVTLDAVGDSDTLIIYSSDHGDMQGAHGLPFKGPFMYEELLNIPFIISWPSRWTEARTHAGLVSQIDLLPTVCDLTGVQAPTGLDGRSLKPALEGRRLDRDLLFSEYHSKQQWANPIRTARNDRWKLNVYLEGARELYDLPNDPDELRNLAGKGYEAERELFDALDAWARRTNDERWVEATASRS